MSPASTRARRASSASLCTRWHCSPPRCSSGSVKAEQRTIRGQTGLIRANNMSAALQSCR
eukprot:1184160-Prorocentrum_minimum.AAC.6